MNIFLPYEDNARKSVESLDNVRLNKQILEIKTLLDFALGNSTAYGKHPVAQFYKNNPNFLAYYGYECCREYYYRFKKWHSLTKYFDSIMNDFNMFEYDEDGCIVSMEIPKFVPYYMSGSKNSADCIRTTENVSALFQFKLIEKWEGDKAKGRTPSWGIREMPQFYKKYLEVRND